MNNKCYSGRERDPSSLLGRLIAGLPSGLAAQMQKLFDQQAYNGNGVSTQPSSRLPKPLRGIERKWGFGQLLSLPNLFVAAWMLVLLWGERWVFQSAVQACRWENWERWPKGATPHHLIFLADPQLIDPHSYPERPGPLQTLTILHTDNYLKRGYMSLQKWLRPDTVFFLGDLFDGGREWKTAHGNTIDPAWANGQRPSGEQKYVETWGKRYGEDFWLLEYDRFGKIFYDFWNLGGSNAGAWQRGRKIISTLPGNHDLGFGANIKIPVRNRFETYFGDGNRVDVIGNHTFVSVDAVSLSAGGSEHDTAAITKPVEDFLDTVQATKRRAVARELAFQAGREPTLHYPHKVEDAKTFDYKNMPSLDPGAGSPEFPTILLTHVPLYRNPGTPCGPKREHWPPETPPKGQTSPVIPDHRNAISISKGYQYQNVLSEDDSVQLISKIGNVRSVYSGDDHDYCEIDHPENKNHAHEITVKSVSYAMGVRKPGFLMLSMWNPVDATGRPLATNPTDHAKGSSTSPKSTESHLCVLPDQLGILIRYGIFIGITILSLTIRSVLVPHWNLTPFSGPYSNSSQDPDFPILPTTNSNIQPRDRSNTSTTSSNNALPTNLAPRSSAARTRSVSPANGYALPTSDSNSNFRTVNTGGPLIDQAGYYGSGRCTPRAYDEIDQMEKERKAAASFAEHAKKALPQVPSVGRLVWRETWMSVWRVAWVVVGVYLYLVKWG